MHGGNLKLVAIIVLCGVMVSCGALFSGTVIAFINGGGDRKLLGIYFTNFCSSSNNFLAQQAILILYK